MHEDMNSHNLTTAKQILVVDDEEDTLDACTQVLRKDGYEIETCNSGLKAIEKLRSSNFDLLIADIKMPKMGGIELLKEAKKIDPQMAVIMITGYAKVETAVESMKEGARDYIPKPFTPDELRRAVKNALERQKLLNENRELKEALKKSAGEMEIIGESQEIKKVLDLINKVAQTDSTVLILGETGTGKELVARQIHYKSKRAAERLMTVNCAAIPPDLLENELFGHEKGAFTGAVRPQKGSFELSHNGTLFFDEIGDMSLPLQSKILRAIQEKEITPLGSEKRIKINVRIVAATNTDLKVAIRKGLFREDLYYRLNVMPINLPPLRERTGDMIILAHHFLRKYNRELKKRIQGFSRDVLEFLPLYNWPGNIRELENAVERAVILMDGDLINLDCFNQIVADFSLNRPLQNANSQETLPAAPFLPLKNLEKDHILNVLKFTQGNRKRAAEILGISVVTLWRKLERDFSE